MKGKKAKLCAECGKRGYPSLLRAIGAALGSSRRRGVQLRIYPCPVRHGYHLTKQEKHGWAA